MKLYFDNAACVSCSRETLDRFVQLQERYFANQESLSFHGQNAAKAVAEAGERLFTTLTCEKNGEGGTLFGNTGSCMINCCIHALGCRLNGGVVTTQAEHASLLMALKRSAALFDFPVYYCPVMQDGSLDLEYLEQLLKKEKISLLALHHIQSETGCIQDLVSIRECLDQNSPRTIFLADTMQSAGKYPLLWQEAKVDLAFVSGSKVGCPGGAALLYRKKYKDLFTSIRNSSHLPGRCPASLCILLAETLSSLCREQEKKLAEMDQLKKGLLALIQKNELAFSCTIAEEKTSKYILHLLSPVFQGAILTRMLSRYGISVSPGSACESETKEPSRTLQSMKIAKNMLYNALRISFWHGNTLAEMEELAAALKECTLKY